MACVYLDSDSYFALTAMQVGAHRTHGFTEYDIGATVQKIEWLCVSSHRHRRYRAFYRKLCELNIHFFSECSGADTPKESHRVRGWLGELCHDNLLRKD